MEGEENLAAYKAKLQKFKQTVSQKRSTYKH